MTNDGFTPTQLDQLKMIVRGEVRDEVSSQLQPVHTKLDDIRQDAQDDSDALNGHVMYQDERLNRIDKHLHLEPLPRP